MRKIVMMFLMVLFVFGIYGCSLFEASKEIETTNEIFITDEYISGSESNVVYIIKTQNQLEAISFLYSDDAVLAKYTSEFFETKGLIIGSFPTSTKGGTIESHKVVGANKALTVSINYKPGFLDVISNCCYILETPKNVLAKYSKASQNITNE